MIESIDFDKKDKAQSPGSVPGNLQILVDVYKHHWDLFLKGYAFYLASCGIFSGFVIQKDLNPNIFQKLFSGIAVSSASLAAIIGTTISYDFLLKMSSRMDLICDECGYEKIYFIGPKRIVKLLLVIAILIGIAGVLYNIHSLVYDDSWRQLLPRKG